MCETISISATTSYTNPSQTVILYKQPGSYNGYSYWHSKDLNVNRYAMKSFTVHYFIIFGIHAWDWEFYLIDSNGNHVLLLLYSHFFCSFSLLCSEIQICPNVIDWYSDAQVLCKYILGQILRRN